MGLLGDVVSLRSLSCSCGVLGEGNCAVKLNLPSENAVVEVMSEAVGGFADFFCWCPAVALFLELLSSSLDEDFAVAGTCEIICAICLLLLLRLVFVG